MYESRLDEGNSIGTAEAGGKGEDVLNVMMHAGAEYMNLQTSGKAGGQAASDYLKTDMSKRQYGRYDETTGRAKTAEEMRVQLREETLMPVKQAVQAGEVQIRKTVEERQQEVPFTLRHEEVIVERHVVDRPVAPGEISDMEDEVISVPAYEERAELQKQARVREEVGISKEAIQEQQTLTGTTRHEHLEVEQSGEVEVVGDTSTDVRTTKGTQKDNE